MGCKAQLPDNGDTWRCDSFVLRGGYCAECLPHFHKRAAEAVKATAAKLNAELKLLLELDEPMLRTTTVTVAELMLADVIQNARKQVEVNV